MPRAIVFDLDGTLIDSAPDLHAAINLVLAEEGAAPVTLAETVGFIGHGIPHLTGLAREARGIAPERQQAMTDAMFRHYLANPATLTRPYADVPEVLTALARAGYRMGLCTNKALAPTLEILDTLDLRRHFSVVIGGDSLPQKKPDPAPLHAAFAALDGPAALYVGDSEVDAETARAAGVDFALFAHGYRKTPVADLPHRFAFEHFRDLPGLLSDHIGPPMPM